MNNEEIDLLIKKLKKMKKENNEGIRHPSDDIDLNDMLIGIYNSMDE